jgi:hypothetical protein
MSLSAKCVCWLGRLGQRLSATPAHKVRYRPTLEDLEVRNVPSTLTVTSLSDTGVSGDGVADFFTLTAVRNGKQQSIILPA